MDWIDLFLSTHNSPELLIDIVASFRSLSEEDEEESIAVFHCDEIVNLILCLSSLSTYAALYTHPPHIDREEDVCLSLSSWVFLCLKISHDRYTI